MTKVISLPSLIRLVAAILIVLLLVPFTGRSFATIEKFWVFLTWGSTVVCVWGSWKARKSLAYVHDQEQSHPEQSWSSARISAVNHMATHLVLLITQIAWFQFGVRLAFTPPGPDASPRPTSTQIHFTATLILTELFVCGLAVFLVFRRQYLVNMVQRDGGD